MATIQIYDHDSAHEKMYKNKMIELEGWLCHLDSIVSDIDRMLEIVNTLSGRKSLLYQKLINIKKESVAQSDALFRYANNLVEIRECEDQQCDQYYGKQHEELRLIYRYNLEKYDKLKEDFFDLVSVSQKG